MSHTTEMTTSYTTKNEEELIESLREHFGAENVEVHEDLSQLYLFSNTTADSYYGEAGKAHIVVRQEAQRQALGKVVATNDLGFARQEDGTYKLFCDNEGFPKASRDKVAEGYAARVAAKQLKKKGYTVKITKTEAGLPKVHASRYA
jgi:hypothetical protein